MMIPPNTSNEQLFKTIKLFKFLQFSGFIILPPMAYLATAVNGNFPPDMAWFLWLAIFGIAIAEYVIIHFMVLPKFQQELANRTQNDGASGTPLN